EPAPRHWPLEHFWPPVKPEYQGWQGVLIGGCFAVLAGFFCLLLPLILLPVAARCQLSRPVGFWPWLLDPLGTLAPGLSVALAAWSFLIAFADDRGRPRLARVAGICAAALYAGVCAAAIYYAYAPCSLTADRLLRFERATFL